MRKSRVLSSRNVSRHVINDKSREAALKECAAFSISWVNSPPGKVGYVLPDEFGGVWASPTLLMYSGLSHSLILGKAWPEFASFVNTAAQGGGWHASIPSEFIPFY